MLQTPESGETKPSFGQSKSIIRTGSNGAFSFTDMMYGTYDVKIAANGFETALVAVFIDHEAPPPTHQHHHP